LRINNFIEERFNILVFNLSEFLFSKAIILSHNEFYLFGDYVTTFKYLINKRY